MQINEIFIFLGEWKKEHLYVASYITLVGGKMPAIEKPVDFDFYGKLSTT